MRSDVDFGSLELPESVGRLIIDECDPTDQGATYECMVALVDDARPVDAPTEADAQLADPRGLEEARLGNTRELIELARAHGRHSHADRLEAHASRKAAELGLVLVECRATFDPQIKQNLGRLSRNRAKAGLIPELVLPSATQMPRASRGCRGHAPRRGANGRGRGSRRSGASRAGPSGDDPGGSEPPGSAGGRSDDLGQGPNEEGAP